MCLALALQYTVVLRTQFSVSLPCRRNPTRSLNQPLPPTPVPPPPAATFSLQHHVLVFTTQTAPPVSPFVYPLSKQGFLIQIMSASSLSSAIMSSRKPRLCFSSPSLGAPCVSGEVCHCTYCSVLRVDAGVCLLPHLELSKARRHGLLIFTGSCLGGM